MARSGSIVSIDSSIAFVTSFERADAFLATWADFRRTGKVIDVRPSVNKVERPPPLPFFLFFFFFFCRHCGDPMPQSRPSTIGRAIGQ